MFDFKKLMKPIIPMHTVLKFTCIFHINRNDFVVLDGIMNILFQGESSFNGTVDPMIKTFFNETHSPFRYNLVVELLSDIFDHFF